MGSGLYNRLNLAAFLAGVCLCPQFGLGQNEPVGWLTYTDEERHFRFQYPDTWKVASGLKVVAHYTDVFVAINSAGRDDFWNGKDRARGSGPGGKPPPTTDRLPAGSIYMDFAIQDGPGPVSGHIIEDLPDFELVSMLDRAEKHVGEGGRSVLRSIGFNKWGRFWRISVCCVEPVTEENWKMARRVLESFQFENIPVGNERWAVNQAHDHLPLEADPEEYGYQGGNKLYWTRTLRICDEVLVSFGKGEPGAQRSYLEGSPSASEYRTKIWQFRVTATGLVIPTLQPRW